MSAPRLQSPVVSNGSETTLVLSPGLNGRQPSVDPRQNLAPLQPPLYKPPPPSQQPPPLPSTPPLDPTQVEEILRRLQSQFSQNGTVMRQHVPIPQGNGGVIPPNQGPYQIGTSGTQDQHQRPPQSNHHPNQGFGPYSPLPPSLPNPPTLALHLRPPSVIGTGTASNAPLSLPRRPTATAGTPSTSTRAEPLGPPPRSGSSTGSFTDERRGPGSYNTDKQSFDERRSGGHDHERDRQRDTHDTSYTRDPRRELYSGRPRDGGWGPRGRVGHR
ncbi:hypothetical protein BU15DRAFT_80524 [Melanogaster broomeanus]|nr:hypothetical protein BU15DRAFT_80524 [Melanogaster broomeanus]